MTNRSPLSVVRASRIGAGIAAAAVLGMGLTAQSASAGTEVDEPDHFTSAFTVMATPDTIINNDGESVPGEDGATGSFTFRVNSDEDIICYDIELHGVTGEYESPAKTATHIHEANAGEPGPPRLAFPNPTGDGDTRTSSGCMQGPFTTGLEADNGNDTADGFTVAQLEENPSGFSADTHTEDFPAGAVRGQLSEVPVGGVDTGLGAMAAPAAPAIIGVAGGVLLAGVLGAGVVTVAKRRA